MERDYECANIGTAAATAAATTTTTTTIQRPDRFA